jgi:DNA-binding XRE family transcriptional regulator
MTRQDLADAANVDLKTVYNLESGTRWPIARTRAAIAAALGWEGDALTAIAGGAVPPGTADRPGADPHFTPEMEAGIVPYLPAIEVAIEVARRLHPGEPLTGARIFPGSPADADSWDRLAAGGHPPGVLARLLAAVQFWADERAAGAGNTHTGLPGG